MIPGTWLAVILFLIVIAPGLFFDLLGTRRRVAVAESAFREIGRVALGSLGRIVNSCSRSHWRPKPTRTVR